MKKFEIAVAKVSAIVSFMLGTLTLCTLAEGTLPVLAVAVLAPLFFAESLLSIALVEELDRR